jgi:hypothetical protein
MLGRSPLVHRITYRRDRGFIIGVVILESDFAGALPDGLCRAEQAGRFAVDCRPRRPGG